RRVLQIAQSFFFGAARLDTPEDPDRIALLEPVERARRGRRLDARERRDRDEPAAGRLDLEIEQRRDRGAVLVADLRNDFVAPIEVVEAIRSEEHTSELN